MAINVDVDGDGYPACDDCDDSDPATFPGAAELCDGVDNDCDGAVDEDFLDLGEACGAGVGECFSEGSFVCSGDGTSVVCDAQPGDPTKELCGDDIDNDCDGEVDEECICPHSLWWWKKHPNEWPVEEIGVGDVVYTKAAAIHILKKKKEKGASKKLTAHLIVTKLNILSGSPLYIQPVVDEADAFLIEYPFGSKPKGAARKKAVDLKKQLTKYNNNCNVYDRCD